MKQGPVTLGYHALERMLQVAEETGAAMVYADHYSVEAGKTVKHPVTAYQLGSIRDDFDFGSVVLLKTEFLKEYAAREVAKDYQFAGWYDLRLFLSRKGELFHLNEYLYTEEEDDLRASGEKQFDYVNHATVRCRLRWNRLQQHTSLLSMPWLIQRNMYSQISLLRLSLWRRQW